VSKNAVHKCNKENGKFGSVSQNRKMAGNPYRTGPKYVRIEMFLFHEPKNGGRYAKVVVLVEYVSGSNSCVSNLTTAIRFFFFPPE